MKVNRKKVHTINRLKRDSASAVSIITNKGFVGYAGWTGFGNLGDEAVYQAAKKLFPEIRSFSTSDRIERLEKLARRSTPLKAFYLGGGTLINRSTEWLQYTRFANERSIPSFCLGSGVADAEFWSKHTPDKWSDNMDQWAKMLKEFTYVGIRGPRSLKKLKKAGVRAEIVGDAAFSLDFSRLTRKSTKKLIGINVSLGTYGTMWGEPDTFIAEIKEFIRKALNAGFSIKLMPMWIDDLDVSIQIRDEISNPDCTLCIAYETVNTYVSEIAECDIFIGEKLHATIFSCMLGIPSVMLAYRPKCFDFMESIEMEKYCLRTDTLKSEDLESALHSLATSHKKVSKQLSETTQYYRDLQKNKAEYIRAQLKL